MGPALDVCQKPSHREMDLKPVDFFSTLTITASYNFSIIVLCKINSVPQRMFGVFREIGGVKDLFYFGEHEIFP